MKEEISCYQPRIMETYYRLLAEKKEKEKGNSPCICGLPHKHKEHNREEGVFDMYGDWA